MWTLRFGNDQRKSVYIGIFNAASIFHFLLPRKMRSAATIRDGTMTIDVANSKLPTKTVESKCVQRRGSLTYVYARLELYFYLFA